MRWMGRLLALNATMGVLPLVILVQAPPFPVSGLLIWSTSFLGAVILKVTGSPRTTSIYCGFIYSATVRSSCVPSGCWSLSCHLDAKFLSVTHLSRVRDQVFKRTLETGGLFSHMFPYYALPIIGNMFWCAQIV